MSRIIKMMRLVFCVMIIVPSCLLLFYLMQYLINNYFTEVGLIIAGCIGLIGSFFGKAY